MDASEQGGIIFGFGMGAMMATVFGAVWLGLNLLAAKEFSWWVAAIFAVCFVALYAGAVRLIRRGRKLRAQGSGQKRWPAARRKQFMWISGAEGAGIAAVILLCGWLGFYSLIELGIALIVGLHFIPLARTFGRPIYYATAAAIVVCCAASWIFLRAQKMDEVAGAGTGMVLWLTATYDLIHARGLVAAVPSRKTPATVLD